MELNKAASLYFDDPSKQNCERVVLAATPMVRRFAALYGGSCCMDDLCQTGMEGVLKALSSYRQGAGASFSTWMGECVISAIRHYVRKEISFRRPGCVVELQAKVDRLIERGVKQTGTPPTEAQLARELGVTEKSVCEVMRAGLVSLDEIDVSNIKTLQYESFQLPIEDRIVLHQALQKLSVMQRRVMHALFFGGLTQEQTAQKLGLHQKKVSRLKQKSLRELEREIGSFNS